MNKVFHTLLAGGLTLSMLSTVMMFAPVTAVNALMFKSLPVCDNSRVLDRIIKRYNKAERNLWRNGVRMDTINAASERNSGIVYASIIDRRYCHAKAFLSDGRHYRVHFVIERGMGLAGTGWNVEYCLKDSDRWYAYGGQCRVLR